MESSTVFFILGLVIIFFFLNWVITKYKVDENSELDKKQSLSSKNLFEEKSDDLFAKPFTKKREVNQNMIEIVQTIIPTLTREEIVKDLKKTGSIEETVENFLDGKTISNYQKINQEKKKNNSKIFDNSLKTTSKKIETTSNINLIEKYNINLNETLDSDTIDVDWNNDKLLRSRNLNIRKKKQILNARKNLENKIMNEKKNVETN